MAHSAAVVANLWDVTDGDLDRFFLKLLEVCMPCTGSVWYLLLHGYSPC